MKSVVSPSFIKQKARQQRKKNPSLSQSQALDVIVKEHGFANYKNYLNELEKNATHRENESSSPLQAMFAEKDLTKKENLAVKFIHDHNPPLKDLFQIVSQFQDNQTIFHHVCAQSDLQNKIQQALLAYFVASKEDVQALPAMKYFIANAVSVRNLRYEFVDEKILATGSYNVEFKFEFDVSEDQKHLPHFRRDPMFGDFESIIDKDANINFENPSIGEEFDNQLFMGSFKLGRI